MSMQPQTPSSGMLPAHDGPAPPPSCPQCAKRMNLKQVTPVLFASSLDDMVFGCDRCRTEVKRTVKRA